jgi:uridine kinase
MTRYRVDYKVTKYIDCVTIVDADSESEAARKVERDYQECYEDDNAGESTECDIELVNECE